MGSLHQRKVKKWRGASNRHVAVDVSPLMVRGDIRCEPSATFLFAVVIVLTGPSLAGSADRELPGTGTFTYCGYPIVAPAMMAAIGR
jgi:hypothetical protein